jgi:hypothetical protein
MAAKLTVERKLLPEAGTLRSAQVGGQPSGRLSRGVQL